MKYCFIYLIIVLPIIGMAQNSDSGKNGFGVAINSSMNGEVTPVRLIPSALYSLGNSQFELGIGTYPFNPKEQRIVSGEFNYKYFPNGRQNKFNMYFFMSFAYIHHHRKTYYPTSYNYLLLSGGYGFQTKITNKLYLGTNVNLGVFTNSKNSENPYSSYIGSKGFFESFGANLSFQCNLGYRF